MTTKKFFAIILSSLLIIGGAIGALNALVNPFGLFEDSLFQWDAYNFTQNPRIAKIGYIDRNHKDFDSYIVGSSGCGAIDPDLLSDYDQASYYNSFYYGSDLWDSYKTIEYLINKGEVKNIFLGLNYNTAMYFDAGEDQLTLRMPSRVTGKSNIAFYWDYLLANPQYSLAKIRDSKKDSFFTKEFDVFLPETGMYDKRGRDFEGIGDLDSYVDREAYRVFQDYPLEEKKLTKIDNFESTMGAIKDLCDRKGVKLQVAVLPIYWEDFQNYPAKDLEDFYQRLAAITEFWDFSKSTISKDPRFFYDSSHFRNHVGRMILAKMKGDEDIYVPQDLGHRVDRNNVGDFLKDFAAYPLGSESYDYSKDLPVLMYHNIGQGDYSLPYEDFKAQMETLKKNGYTSVSLGEIYDYVYRGKDLPEKPILITFDDGYMSNYDLAYPLLRDMDMHGVIFAIGYSFGMDSYKDTGQPILPHFGMKEAREMVQSGHIEIQSHSYDMHQAEKYETKKPARIHLGQLEGETEEEYIQAFMKDFDKSNRLIEDISGQDIHAFSYPTGYFTQETQSLLGIRGVKASFTSDSGVNTLIKGLPQSLMELKRIEVTDKISPEDLIGLLEKK